MDMEFISQNVVWVALAAVSGSMLLSSLIRGRLGPDGVSPMSATLMINREDALVLDVRDAAAFATGHIAGARNIELGKLKERLVSLDKFKKKPVIVVCQRGHSAAAACGTLRRGGFEKVFKLAGGLAAWEESSQPLARS
jgi:rhodanese-related sulfurtransferase